MPTVILREATTHAEREFLVRLGSPNRQGLIEVPCVAAEPSAAVGYLTVRFLNTDQVPVSVDIPTMLVLMVFHGETRDQGQRNFGFAPSDSSSNSPGPRADHAPEPSATPPASPAPSPDPAPKG